MVQKAHRANARGHLRKRFRHEGALGRQSNPSAKKHRKENKIMEMIIALLWLAFVGVVPILMIGFLTLEAAEFIQTAKDKRRRK